MSKEIFVGSCCTGLSAIATSLQTNQIFETIQIIITCISGLITIAMMIYNWYQKAKKDGKISADEVKDLIDTVKDEVEEIKDKLDNEKEE